MSIQDILSYVMGILQGMQLMQYVSATVIIVIASIALSTLLNIFRR